MVGGGTKELMPSGEKKNENRMTTVMDRPLILIFFFCFANVCRPNCGKMKDSCLGVWAHGLKMKDGG